MDFPVWLAYVLRGIGVVVTSDPMHGFFVDDHGAFLDFWIHNNKILNLQPQQL